jgi:hypothetical protein
MPPKQSKYKGNLFSAVGILVASFHSVPEIAVDYQILVDGNPITEKPPTMGKEVESLDLLDMEVRGPKV